MSKKTEVKAVNVQKAEPEAVQILPSLPMDSIVPTIRDLGETVLSVTAIVLLSFARTLNLGNAWWHYMQSADGFFCHGAVNRNWYTHRVLVLSGIGNPIESGPMRGLRPVNTFSFYGICVNDDGTCRATASDAWNMKTAEPASVYLDTETVKPGVPGSLQCMSTRNGSITIHTNGGDVLPSIAYLLPKAGTYAVSAIFTDTGERIA